MNILLFAIGKSIVLHIQAQYAIRSLYVNKHPEDKLFIMTDSPVLYQHIPFIEVIELTHEEIEKWIGEGSKQYFFRAKLKAIEKFAGSHSKEHLAYVDCDIYCLDNISKIKGLLDSGIGVMHKDEGSMTLIKGDSGMMWQQTKNKSFAGINISEKHHMWNSGVVAIPAEKAQSVINKAIELCDAFLAAGVTCFNLEQWSIAIALKESTKDIVEADHLIGHYWHHKYIWCKYISNFFVDSYAHGRTIEEELEIIKSTNHKILAKKLAIKRFFRKILCKTY